MFALYYNLFLLPRQSDKTQDDVEQFLEYKHLTVAFVLFLS